MEDGVEGETRGAGRSPAAEVATRGASTPSSSTRRSIVVVEDEATVRTPSTPSWVRTRYHAANSASARSATALATRLRERLLRAIARKTRARASRPSDATAGVGVVASVKTTTSADIRADERHCASFAPSAVAASSSRARVPGPIAQTRARATRPRVFATAARVGVAFPSPRTRRDGSVRSGRPPLVARRIFVGGSLDVVVRIRSRERTTPSRRPCVGHLRGRVRVRRRGVLRHGRAHGRGADGVASAPPPRGFRSAERAPDLDGVVRSRDDDDVRAVVVLGETRDDDADPLDPNALARSATRAHARRELGASAYFASRELAERWADCVPPPARPTTRSLPQKTTRASLGRSSHPRGRRLATLRRRLRQPVRGMGQPRRRRATRRRHGRRPEGGGEHPPRRRARRRRTRTRGEGRGP